METALHIVTSMFIVIHLYARIVICKSIITAFVKSKNHKGKITN